METVFSWYVMNLISEYKWQHQDPKRYRGASLKRHGPLLRPHIKKRKITSILDFGSGKGFQYKERLQHEEFFGGILPTLYDPAVEGIDVLPNKMFDAVINTDVLEHIEDFELDKTLETIYSKANKFVYHGIANWATGRKLKDGRDVHVIQENIEWWVNRIKPFVNVPTLIWVATRRDKTITDKKVPKEGHGIVLIENNVITKIQ